MLFARETTREKLIEMLKKNSLFPLTLLPMFFSLGRPRLKNLAKNRGNLLPLSPIANFFCPGKFASPISNRSICSSFFLPQPPRVKKYNTITCSIVQITVKQTYKNTITYCTNYSQITDKQTRYTT